MRVFSSLGIFLVTPVVLWTLPTPVTEVAVASERPTFQGAVGASAGFLSRRDFGEGTSRRFFLEPNLQTYVATPWESLFLRGSLHFSYVWQQPEMPRALKVTETDAYGGLALGVVYDGVLVPSLAAGVQAVRRSVTLESAAPIESRGSRVGGTETLWVTFVQGGLGIPLLKGLLVFEPFYRFRFVPNDEREGGAYGIDVSVQLF